MQQMPFHPESMTTGTNYFRALPEMSLVCNRLSLFFNCAPLLLQQLQSTCSRHYGPRPNVCRPAHIPNIPPSSDTCSDTIPPKSQPGLLSLLQKPPSHLLGPFFCIRRAPPGLAGRTVYSLALVSSLLVQPLHPFATEKPLLVWCLGSQWHRGSAPASTSSPKDALHPHSHHICNSLQGGETIPEEVGTKPTLQVLSWRMCGVPGMERAEKDRVSNDHAEQAVGTCWCFVEGNTPTKFLPTGCCCLSTLAAHHNHMGLGPSPGNSGPATVGWSLKWGFLTSYAVRGESLCH